MITIIRETFIVLVGGNTRPKDRHQEEGRVRGKGKEADSVTGIIAAIISTDHLTTIIVTSKIIHEGHKGTLITHKITNQINTA